MAYSVPADKNLRIPFSFQTASGKPAKVQDGSVTVTSSDEKVATVSIDGDAILVATAGPGSFTGTISGDADLGDGVTLVSATFDVTVTPLNAEAVVLGDGVEADKP